MSIDVNRERAIDLAVSQIEKRFTIHRLSPGGVKFTRFTMEPG